ncbi:MAG: VIT domain-containing protein [Phycisphaerales bacterium]
MTTRHLLASALMFALGPVAAVPIARAQIAATSTEPVIIVPQGRTVVFWPTPRPPENRSIKLTKADASVQVTDQIALTTLVLTVTNDGGGAQEAQLVVPVPDGAAVRSFQLDSLGAEPNAKLYPRDEARRIYDGIVSKSRDPGLLEFIGYNLIKSSVFPVPARGTQTLRLTYEQLLPTEGTSSADRIDFVIPRTESLDDTGVAWSFTADIRSSRAISTIYSPSHEIVTERTDAGRMTVRLLNTASVQPGSFRVSYLLPRRANEVSATVMMYPDPEIAGGQGGYFLLLAGVPAKPPENAIKREVTVVLDRSGSMRGQKIIQAREAALQVVEGLAPGEFFNIIDYSDSINSFSDHAVVKNDETMAAARKYIAGINANGGTNINDSLLEALRQDPTPGTLPVVLFLTDGLPTVGQTSERAIREAAAGANKHNRRIFTFGVGLDVNGPLLTGLSRGTRATSTFVLPEENVEVKVGQVYRRLSGPILASPKLEAIIDAKGEVVTRPIREVQPASLPDLFDGDQLVILGQYTDASAKKLILEGNYLGKQATFDFAFDTSKATTRNGFVPRLWASRKIASLIEEIRQAGADQRPGVRPSEDPRTKELVDEIVRLSIKWGILTEYTAFLALEPGTVIAGRPGDPMPMADGGAGSRDVPRVDLMAALRSAQGSGPSSPFRAPQEAAERKEYAQTMLSNRAKDERWGGRAINQEMNLGRQVEIGCVNVTNEFISADMKKTQVNTVCQVADQTLFRRGQRWVDARIVQADKEKEAPEVTITFGTPAYTQLVDDLAARNQVALLAQGDECMLMYQGKRTLVLGPRATP